MPSTIPIKKALYEWRLYLFILPSLLMVGVFIYLPTFSAVYHSFFNWRGGDAKEYIGLENFVHLWNDDILWQSLLTVTVLILANIVKMLPSIALAVVIHRLTSDRWQYWYRVLVVVPMIVPELVRLFIWKFFYDPNFGVLNRLLDLFEFKPLLIWLDNHFLHWEVFREGIPIPWLSDPHLIVPSIIFWGFPWIGAVGVLIFLAGLESINKEIYETAELDGATGVQKFLYIELPLILTQIRLMIILLVIGTIQGFGLQLLLLGQDGGAGGAGMVPGLWMYNRAFGAGQFGYACSIGLFLFVIILTLTWVNNKYIRVQK
jgi:ABC-type sugar transport system permease subunit